MKLALRQLLKNPGFTAVAILTLALGIGANTALFSVINALLIRSLPYPEPERLVAVCESNARLGWDRYVTSLGAYADWRSGNSVFQELAGAMVLGPTPIASSDGSDMVHVASVSANFFPLLGLQPLLGRQFRPEDESPGSGDVVLLSENLWRARFAADPSIVNQSVLLGDRAFIVVGVMPATLRLFDPAGIQGWDSGFARSDLWRPLPVKSGLAKQRSYRAFLVLGRLKANVDVAQAQAEMTILAKDQALLYPKSNEGWGVSVEPFNNLVVGQVRWPLLLLFGAVGLVLLTATANLANLALARAVSRQKEVAIRMALGASPFRIARQFMGENLLLACLGGIGGLVLAQWTLGILIGFVPASVPRIGEISLDGRVLGFTLLVSLAVGSLLGLAPILTLRRRNLNRGLNSEGRGSTGGIPGRRLRTTLVVAQVALVTILLSGAGLLLRSFQRLSEVHPGFRPEQLIAADVSFNGRNYMDGLVRIAAAEALLNRLTDLSPNETFAAVDGLPLDSGRANMDIALTGFEGRSPVEKDAKRVAGLRLVSPTYFTTMGMAMSQGRMFEKRDNTNAPAVAIINQTLARRFFPGVDPIGKLISSPDFGSEPCEVVGIIQDIKHAGLDAPAQPEVYRPLFQQCFSGITIVGQGLSASGRIVDRIREAMVAVDRNCPVYHVRSLHRLVADSLASRRFALWLAQLFAGLSLLLASVGIYGVLSCVVEERTREFGIRLAVGAQRTDIVGMVFRDGFRSVLVGGGLGLVGAYGLTRVLRSVLYEVSPTDPLTFGLSCLLVVCAALAAGWMPARRAARVDPMEALRDS